jgi:hypothetical protein
VTERFTNPQHDVIFRGVHLSRDLLRALEAHDILLDLSFGEVEGIAL